MVPGKKFGRRLNLRLDGTTVVRQISPMGDLEKLHDAAYQLDLKRVKSLLSKGVSPTKKDKDGADLLFFACDGTMVSVDATLEKDQAAIIRLAVEHGAEVNAPYPKFGGFTPLIVAASGGAAGAVRVLHELGAEVDLADEHGFTPLHRAALSGRADAVRVLLELGADATARTSDKKTALDLAIGGQKESSGLETEDFPGVLKLLKAAKKKK